MTSVPRIQTVRRPPLPGWALYGGRLLAFAPVAVRVDPGSNDKDPLDLSIEMELDIANGRLVCTELTARRIAEDGPGVTGEELRRIPVAKLVEIAALELNVLLERNGPKAEWSNVEPPPKDFAKDGMTDDALEMFSRAYAAVQATGRRPSGVFLNVYGMPRGTSSRWLATAKRRGILVEDHRRLELDAGEPTSYEKLDAPIEQAHETYRRPRGQR
jgi:hypothetical protein